MRLRDWAFILIITVLVASTALACEADYIIWMIRSESADGLFRFIRNGKAGYIDRTGKIVVPPTLETSGNYGGEFHDGRLGIRDGQYIDASGKRFIDKRFAVSWEFSEGLAAARLVLKGKWGYIDTTGMFVIPPQFDGFPAGDVDSFSDGLAKITVGDRVGYIDKAGGFAVQPKFLSGSQFHNDRAWVVVEGPCTYWTVRVGCPDFVKLPRSASDQEARSSCKYALIDKSGTILSTDRFVAVGDFSEGLAPVRVGDHWGFIDAQGSMVVPPRFLQAVSFREGLALISLDRGPKPRFGYINHDGVIVLQPQFAYAENFSAERAIVATDIEGPYWFIDKSGAPAFNDRFVFASSFAKGLAHVKLFSSKADENDRSNPKGPYAYIDPTGRQVFRYVR